MKKKTALTILVWVLIFLSALLDEILPADIVNSTEYYFLVMVIMLFSIFAWFMEDAEEIGFKPSIGLRIGVILFAVVAIPYYRFKHTGFKKGMLFIVKILGMFLLMSFFLGMLLIGLGYEEIV